MNNKISSSVQIDEALKTAIHTRLKDLEENKTFKDLTKTVYEETVLSFGGQAAFPQEKIQELFEVNNESIISAARGKGWAAAYASKGISTQDGYLYYKNNIPVYYKSANGNLSAKPVILLKQEKSNFLASFLSKIGFSTKEGLKIPKGMLLAINDIGKFSYYTKPGWMQGRSDIARTIQQKIYKEGFFEVEVDCPYTTTELLSIAKLLSSKLDVNFELTLSKSNSFKPFINLVGSLTGLRIGRVMMGPFKDIANNSKLEIVQKTTPIAFGGTSYITPKIAGELTPLMQNWGMDRSTLLVLAITFITLAIAVLLGINGFKNIDNFSLITLLIPMLVLLLTASLLASAAPLLLNRYKNPLVRTVANLNMSTYKQGACFVLSLITFFVGFIGLNPFIVIPIALVLVLATICLFFNTFLGEKVLSDFFIALKNPMHLIKNIYNGIIKVIPVFCKSIITGVLGPISDFISFIKNKKSFLRRINPDEQRYLDSYNKEFLTTQEAKDAILRVRLAYASYAASIILMNQLVVNFNAPLGELLNTSSVKWNQLLVATFAFSSFIFRKKATTWIQSERFTDDQLTGISFVGLAVMPLLLAIIPYEGIGWIFFASLLGIGLDISTAVPGQLDNVRLQNIVTAIIQSNKNTVQQNNNFSEAEKRIQIEDLEKKEIFWAAQAGKEYLNSNAKGVYGIYVAIIISVIFSLLKIDSQWIFRSIFAYAGLTALYGSYKTFYMAMSFIKAIFNRKNIFVITKEDILNKTVTPETFGIATTQKAYTLLSGIRKGKDGIEALSKSLSPYGIILQTPEKKLTSILNKIVKTYNRLVAISEKIGEEDLNDTFTQLYDLVTTYKTVLEASRPSVSLKKHFFTLFNAFIVHEDILGDKIQLTGYIPEGNIQIPVNYQKLLEAEDLISEMKVLSRYVKKEKNNTALKKICYLFSEYEHQSQENLKQYLKDNPSEEKLILQKRGKIDIIRKEFDKNLDSAV